MQRSTQRLYKMDNALQTDIYVEQDEPFVVELLNAYGRSFVTPEEMEMFFHADNEATKQALGHPCTGPVELIGNHGECSLQIKIVDIKISAAYQCLSKSSGVLKHTVISKRHCQIFDLKSTKHISFDKGHVVIPTAPSLGFIGTLNDTVMSCGRASQQGGNIDLNYLKTGATITLPIDAAKARLVVGDLHLLQGNGEASGTGIEADGQVILSMKAVKKVPFPVIEDDAILCIVGWGTTLENCLTNGVINSISYLQQQTLFQNWQHANLYQLVSATSNMVIGNATGKVKTCGIVFDKHKLLDSRGSSIL